MAADARATEEAAENLMGYIALIAVIGMLLLVGTIPPSGVGGAMTIGWALLVVALAIGVHEAWTRKRGVLGWIVNIVVSFVGAFLVAPLGGMVVVLALGPFIDSSSLAATGGPVMFVAVAGMVIITLLGSWGALWIVNRWR